ncbi:MAG: NAD-dependent epimerase/dehydratase family protein [Chloroflexi bacterium]|nr:NAD-dependent epimerase/dehydratase family protein [Chloroflexota bacterium]
MKVLVTGGAGFIGSHMVDALIAQGHEVAVVDDLSTGRRQNLHPQARLYVIDIGDEKLAEVFERERPKLVYHFAAQVSVRHSMDDPAHDARVNILGSLNVLESCRRHGVDKLVYASSGGAVYGEPEYLPCDEVHPVHPLCPYGVSKLTVEHYLFLYHQWYGLNYVALRLPNVYGPRQDPFGEAGVVAIFSRQMLTGETVVINGNGEQERDFLYVGDVVDASLQAGEKGDGLAVNIGTGTSTSVNQLFQRLKAITGYSRDAVHGPPKAGETFKIYLAAQRASQELGWRPRVGLEEGLRRTVAYFQEAGGEGCS